MTKPVTHLSKVSNRPDVTVTGTLCNRMMYGSDGMNCTTEDDAVTCKLCLREMKYRKKAA